METDQTPSEKTRDYLIDLMLDSFRGIELGHAYALSHFEADGEKLQEERLFNTMRYKTRLYLEEKGYALRDLPMHGLHVLHKGYEIKIIKARKDGNVPIAGKSKQRYKYYNHYHGQTTFQFDDVHKVIEELGLETRRELIVLYKVGRDGSFLGIDLACVESAEHQYGVPLLAWRESVPHPAQFANNYQDQYQEKPIDLKNVDVQDDDREDLDIFKDGTND